MTIAGLSNHAWVISPRTVWAVESLTCKVCLGEAIGNLGGLKIITQIRLNRFSSVYYSKHHQQWYMRIQHYYSHINIYMLRWQINAKRNQKFMYFLWVKYFINIHSNIFKIARFVWTRTVWNFPQVIEFRKECKYICPYSNKASHLNRWERYIMIDSFQHAVMI